MKTIRRARLATKGLLLAVAALALVAGAWASMSPAAQDGPPAVRGHIALDPGTGEEILFRELVDLTTEVVPGDKRDQPRRPSVVLRRGLSTDTTLWDWHAQVRAGAAAARRDATLTLYDAAGTRIMGWKLDAARPTKISATDIRADGNEVAIQTVEIAAEGLHIEP